MRPVRFWAAIVRSGRSFTQPGRGLERLRVVGSGTAAPERAQAVSCLSFKLSWRQLLNERISPAPHIAVDEYDDAQPPLVVHLRLAVTLGKARWQLLDLLIRQPEQVTHPGLLAEAELDLDAHLNASRP